MHQSRWLPTCGTISCGRSLSTDAVRLAREAGALATLPVALSYRATLHVHAGEFATASALIEESDSISEATGNAPLPYTSLVLAAWRGAEGPAVRLIQTATKEATNKGEGRAFGLAHYATAVLYNGLGATQRRSMARDWPANTTILGFTDGRWWS